MRNPEKRRASNLAYYRRNKEKICKKTRAYRQRNNKTIRSKERLRYAALTSEERLALNARRRAYYKRNHDRLRLQQNEYRQQNRENQRTNERNRYYKNPEQVCKKKLKYSHEHPKQVKNTQLKSEYGITLSQLNKLKKKQKSKCKLCHETPKKLVVDHNHETGEIRGLICYRCNNMLGQAKDSVKLLTSGIHYLKTAKVDLESL